MRYARNSRTFAPFHSAHVTQCYLSNVVFCKIWRVVCSYRAFICLIKPKVAAIKRKKEKLNDCPLISRLSPKITTVSPVWMGVIRVRKGHGVLVVLSWQPECMLSWLTPAFPTYTPARRLLGQAAVQILLLWTFLTIGFLAFFHDYDVATQVDSAASNLP